MSRRKTLRYCAVTAALALAGCASTADDGRYVDLSNYDRGKQHFNAGQFGLAIKYFQSAVDRDPASIEALNALAASYDRLGRYDLASRYYDRALAADPESTQTLNNIGYSYLLQKRFDLAVAYLRDAQSRDKGDSVILTNRSVAEVAFQEADLKRSKEDAANPDLAEAPPAVPVAPVDSAPVTRITVATAVLPRPARKPDSPVKPWIERTAPLVQSLVTEPQSAMVGVAEQAGVNPQIAAYRPQQREMEELLPDPLSAPLALDDKSPDIVNSWGSSAAATGTVDPDADGGTAEPALPSDSEPSGPVVGLVPQEVSIASLDPTAGLRRGWPEQSVESDTTAKAGSLSEDASLASLEPWAEEEASFSAEVPAAAPWLAKLLPTVVTVVSLQPMTEAVQGSSIEAEAPVAAPLTDLLPTDVVVAELTQSDPAGQNAARQAETRSTRAAKDLARATVRVASTEPVMPVGSAAGASEAGSNGGNLPFIEVSNGAGRLEMAARLRSYLEGEGVDVRRLTNADTFTHMETTVYYREGWQEYAEDLARRLPAVIDLKAQEGQYSDIRVELGGDLLDFDRDLYYARPKSSGGQSG